MPAPVNGGTLPAAKCFAITKNDSADLAFVTRGIYVGATGDLAVILDADSSAVTFVGLAAGIIHPLAVKRVMSTNTTATSIVGVY